MRKFNILHRLSGLLVAFSFVVSPTARGSDHADPMSLNVFKVQGDPAANITDLHAFIVDGAGKLVTEGNPLLTGDRLIISLCVRRALRPNQIQALQLRGFQFRVHIDPNPPVRFFDETKTRDGDAFQARLAALNQQVKDREAALAEARKDESPEGKTKQAAADREWKAALAGRGKLLADQDADRSMQALYGGIVTKPDDIADPIEIDYELDLVEDGENSQAIIVNKSIRGIATELNVVTTAKQVNGVEVVRKNDFKPGVINLQAGVFDDPFIFPRFFRTNIVGVVASIPLSSLPKLPEQSTLLLWATTHRGGQQIDHVGRSLRTQLPRFGYLNEKPPAQHVREITRVHDKPTITENLFATVVAPLFAHRHYDSAPDVMIYDLRKPAKFPNGRALPDDVAKTLADAGETLLLELSYAESKQFPRATTNDKEFSPDFPYLAPRWTSGEVAEHAAAGTMMGDQPRPRAPDSAAIAALNLNIHVWRTLWRLEIAALGGILLALLLTVHSRLIRLGLILVAVIAFWFLWAIYAPHLPAATPAGMMQPSLKLNRLLVGGFLIFVFLLGWFFALGRRHAVKYPPEDASLPRGEQGLTLEDRQYEGSRFAVVREAVLAGGKAAAGLSANIC